MHEQAKKKLNGALLQYLRTCSIRDGRMNWDGDRKALEQICTLEEKHLHQWVTELSVLAELARRTATALASTQKRDGNSLVDCVGKEAVENITADVVDLFAELPRNYDFWAHLRGLDGLELDEPLQVTDTIALEQVAERPTRNALTRALMSARGLYDPPLADFRDGDCVLRIKVKGYSAGYLSDSAPEAALSVVKEFVVLAEALKVFSLARSRPSTMPTGLLAQLDDKGNGEWISDVPVHVSRHIDNYTLNKNIADRVSILDLADNAITPGSLIQNVQSALQPLEAIFSPQESEHATAIRTAAHWYFDAETADNETNSFLFTCLGFEALLGGKPRENEEIGLGTLLANRFAYFMGTSRRGRQNLLSEFRKFYGIRSSIVHGRKAKLEFSDRRYLFSGKRLLRALLAKELTQIE